MARDINTDFTVSDTIIIQNKLLLSDLQMSANQQSPGLQLALINKRIAELNLKQVKAGRYPTVSLNSGYNFNRSTSELGFARSSVGRGLNYGMTASINIFNGMLQNRNEKNASIEIDNAQLEYEKLNQNISAQLTSRWRNSGWGVLLHWNSGRRREIILMPVPAIQTLSIRLNWQRYRSSSLQAT
jgi:outer membrane protein TolC